MRSRPRWSKPAAKRDRGGVNTIWLIGCGNMAGAMLTRWLATGVDPARFTVIDPGLPDVSVRVLATVPDEAAPDMLMLGVKPQVLSDVAPGLAAGTRDTLLVSILAGTTTATLSALFPAARAVLRVMPNLPVALGKGVAALHGDLPEHDRERIAALMAPLGLVEWIDDEAMFDAVTALSGSGPALVYRFIDALAAAGVSLGLATDQAMRLARATVEGAAVTATTASEAVSVLADRVASKGGSTRAALDILDDREALVALISHAVAVACDRNGELAGLSARG